MYKYTRHGNIIDVNIDLRRELKNYKYYRNTTMYNHLAALNEHQFRITAGSHTYLIAQITFLSFEILERGSSVVCFHSCIISAVTSQYVLYFAEVDE